MSSTTAPTKQILMSDMFTNSNNVGERNFKTQSEIDRIIETSNRGSVGLPVYVQDQTTGVLDLPFLQIISNPTLAVDTVIDSRAITLVAGHGAAVGNIIELSDNTNGSWFMQARILSISTNVLTIDTPINRIYSVGATTAVLSSDIMRVNGSVSPVKFEVKPLSTQKGDIVRLICTITDNADMDFETFGGLPALTNGIVLRVRNQDGTHRNIANFKTNGDIERYSFDTAFEVNNGGGIRSFSARMTWGGQSKHGVVVRLDGSLGESLELIIQDNLTGLASMSWMAQGSELQE